MRLLVGLLLAAMFAAIALNASALPDAVRWASLIGTAVVLEIGIAYAVYDSRRRWPAVGAMDRLGKIFFFER